MALKPYTPVVTAAGFSKGNSLFDGFYTVDGEGLVRFAGRLALGSSAVLGEGTTFDVSLPLPAHSVMGGRIVGNGYVTSTDNPTLLCLSSDSFRVYYRSGGAIPTADLLGPEYTFVFSGSYWTVA